ncbi:MAG: dephospho-CoA kinase [Moraxellaceae bacterium]|jgi:dephospho-CoA kinase
MKQFKIGITGGIGTGKSTVSKILIALGYPVYFSDDRAKWLMENNQQLVADLTRLLGDETYKAGKLNRSFIAEKLFSNSQLKKKINELVHPVVRNDFNDWADTQEAPLLFQESALLVETGAYQLFDALIVITAPLEQRIQRIQKRDGISINEINMRLTNQLAESEKIAVADYVISNDDYQPIVFQIQKIVGELLKQIN